MKTHKLLSVNEYIQQEVESNTKYEYHNGKIFALAGGTLNHGLICGNIYSEMRMALKNKETNCLPFNSDVKLFIEATNSFVYPDSMVICGAIEELNEHAVTNPILVVEVLSKSTAEYDRGDKFHLYRQILSFREYVLIEQKKHIVDIHYKHAKSDLWKITRYVGLEKKIVLQSLDIEISMVDLYYRTKITPPA